MRFWTGLTGMLMSVALLAGCGGGSSGSKTAQLRLLNASVGYPSLDLSINGTVKNSAVAYGAAGSYVDVTTDAITTAISVAGLSSSLSSSSRSLTKDTHYTLVGYGWQGALKTALIQEDVAAADSGKAKVAVLNLAVDAGSVDVYLTGSTDALADASAVTSGVAGGGGSAYTSIGAGTYRLRVTGASDKTDLRLDVSGLTLDSTKVATLVLTSGVGGVLVNGVTMVQQGATATFANNLARARVVAAVSGNGAVSASLGGNVLSTSLVSPNPYNSYVQFPVTAASLPVSLSVNGSAFAVPAQAVVAGGDYTLLVWGDKAAPQVTLVTDDNRLPLTTNTGKIRLFNAMHGAAAPLTLNSDISGILANNVPQGTASAFFPNITASTSVRLQVISPLSVTPLEDITGYNIVSKGVYSFFMFGDAGDKTTWSYAIRKER